MQVFSTGDQFIRTFIVTQHVYDGFITTFRDHNPLHTDEQFAVSHGFEGRVMHGNILNGFISYFVGECLPDKNVIIYRQEIEFKKPIYLNDKLLFEAKIIGIYASVGAIDFQFIFKNDALKIVSKGKIQVGLIK